MKKILAVIGWIGLGISGVLIAIEGTLCLGLYLIITGMLFGALDREEKTLVTPNGVTLGGQSFE